MSRDHDERGQDPVATRNLMLRVAAGLFWLTPIGLSAFIAPVARHPLKHQELPVILGIRSFSGPFEAFGVKTFVFLLTAFQVVSILRRSLGG